MTTALVVTQQPAIDGIEDFFKKYPNAGSKRDDLIRGHGFSTFTKEKIQDYDNSRQESMLDTDYDYEMYDNEVLDELDNDYEILDDDGLSSKNIYQISATEWFDEDTKTFIAKASDQGLPESSVIELPPIMSKEERQLLELNREEEERGIELTPEEIALLDQTFEAIHIEDNGLDHHEYKMAWRELSSYENHYMTLDFFKRGDMDDYINTPISNKEWKQIRADVSDYYKMSAPIQSGDYNADLFAIPRIVLSATALSEMLEEYAQTELNDSIGIITFSEPTKPPIKYDYNMKIIKASKSSSKIGRLKTLIEQLADEEHTPPLSKNVRSTDVIGSYPNTPQDVAFSNRFIAESKRRSIDFLTHKPQVSLINTIPEMVRRDLKYVGSLIDLEERIEMYTFKDRKWSNGKRLVQSLIMANHDRLWYTLRNQNAQAINRGITFPKREITTLSGHLNKRTDEWLVVGDYKYPRHFIEPYVKNDINQHGIVIAKEVTANDGGVSLFIPYGDVTLTVTGTPKFNVINRR